MTLIYGAKTHAIDINATVAARFGRVSGLSVGDVRHSPIVDVCGGASDQRGTSLASSARGGVYKRCHRPSDCDRSDCGEHSHPVRVKVTHVDRTEWVGYVRSHAFEALFAMAVGSRPDSTEDECASRHTKSAATPPSDPVPQTDAITLRARLAPVTSFSVATPGSLRLRSERGPRTHRPEPFVVPADPVGVPRNWGRTGSDRAHAGLHNPGLHNPA